MVLLVSMKTHHFFKLYVDFFSLQISNGLQEEIPNMAI